MNSASIAGKMWWGFFLMEEQTAFSGFALN